MVHILSIMAALELHKYLGGKLIWSLMYFMAFI